MDISVWYMCMCDVSNVYMCVWCAHICVPVAYGSMLHMNWYVCVCVMCTYLCTCGTWQHVAYELICVCMCDVCIFVCQWHMAACYIWTDMCVWCVHICVPVAHGSLLHMEARGQAQILSLPSNLVTGLQTSRWSRFCFLSAAGVLHWCACYRVCFYSGSGDPNSDPRLSQQTLSQVRRLPALISKYGHTLSHGFWWFLVLC